MQPKSILLLVILYVASTTLAFGGFKLMGGTTGGGMTLNSKGGLAQLISPIVPKSSGGVNVDQSLPKTEVCPLNGQKFSVPEREAWEKRRPLTVMIENHMDARPQSGLSKADIVYEAMAEGGITRFMSVYLCDAQSKDTILAPVRSAREHFIQLASDYNFPLYAHVGGANGEDTDPRVRALEHLNDYKWAGANDLNQFSIGYPVFVRNYNRIPNKDLATEHTMESSTNRLWDYAATKRGLTNVNKTGVDWQTGFVKWTFAEDASSGDRGVAQKVSHEFWEGFKQFAVEWSYDPVTNLYKRAMAGEPHIDMNDGQQLAVKNVVTMFVEEIPSVDIHKHVYDKVTGTGKAIIFQNGKKIDATWSKKDRVSRLTFTDSKGKVVPFVAGKIWISVLAKETPVSVL